MKRTNLLTILGFASLLVSNQALAIEPKARFAGMKKAVLAAADKKPAGSWKVLDGKLTQLPAGVDHSGNTRIISGSDLSSLPPEQRAAVEAALKKAKENRGGSGTVSTSSGPNVRYRTMPSSEAKALIRLDLDETHYQSIAFGATRDTLVLMPKGDKSGRLVVQLDSKSNLPKTIAVERSSNGKWSLVRKATVDLNPGK